MLQAANTDLLVSKAHNSECQNLLFPLQINPLVPRVQNIKIRHFNFKLTFSVLILKKIVDFDTHYCEI